VVTEALRNSGVRSRCRLGHGLGARLQLVVSRLALKDLLVVCRGVGALRLNQAPAAQLAAFQRTGSSR